MKTNENNELKLVASFSERFKELINGNSYQVVAEKLGISKATVGAYATGTRDPKLVVLKQLAQEYGVDPLWLAGYDVPKYKEISDTRAYLIEVLRAVPEDKLEIIRSFVDKVLAL